MLQDETVEYIKEQFDEKNAVLAAYGEQVSAWTLYEDLYGSDHMQDVMPIVVLGEDEQKHIVPMPLDIAIEQASGRNDMLVGSCTYFNNWISKRSAKDLYGFIVDMDNVYSGTLQNALKADWRTANGEALPMPTYIVNSGTGLHLYYLFTEPIPHYKGSARALDTLYRALAIQQTTKRVFLQRQVQWFGQNFRFAGGLNKYGWKNTVYRPSAGKRWDIDDLAAAVGMPSVHITRYNEPKIRATSSQPRKLKRTGWRSSEKFYDYALDNCRSRTREGNRYTSMCALSVIAWKCGVSREQLEKDLMALLPMYNKGATAPVRESEIRSALKMYNDRAMLTQRQTLEVWQGWEYKPIKRNGRKQTAHLARARAVQAIDYPNGEWRHVPPTLQQQVQSWRLLHPEGKKIDCHRDTGISRMTINKWWDS